jgi:hypothetical protein
VPECLQTNPAQSPGFLLPRIQPSGEAREDESKKQSVGRARTAREAVTRQVGETDFSRHPRTGEYLHPCVAMGWRIHKKNQ